MECPHIPITNYGEFSKRLHDSALGKRLPIKGSIEVTARCNLYCSHCYINLPADNKNALDRELSRKDFCYLIDQIVDEGCLWLLLTGGEPFIRPDLIDIYTHAKKKGLLITLFTNGTLVTPSLADHLAEWRPFAVEITLYGSTQATYERVTGIPGSYKRSKRGIELLLERKIPLKLKAMVLTINKHEIQDIRAYAEGLGLDFRIDPMVNVRLNGDRSPSQFRIPPEEVVKLDMADEKRMKAWQNLCDRSLGPPHKPEYLYQCGAGKGMFHIDPYGKLSACIMSRHPSYDLRGGKFHEGWHAFMPTVRAQKWLRETPCKSCDLIFLCGQCPGIAQNETGNQEIPVEYLCQIAHMRAVTFGLKKLNKEGNDYEEK
jgi:radical SAM protein with 4Fe4S-binding SPASM domain